MKGWVHHNNDIPEAVHMALAQERLHHRTKEGLFAPGPLPLEVEYIETPGLHGYGDSLARVWDLGKGFIILEHDVAPWPGALTELWNCPEPLCTLPVIFHGAINHTSFACVKFSEALVKKTQGIWKAYPRNDIFYWQGLDGWFNFQMEKREEPIRRHSHRPPALHVEWEHTDPAYYELRPSQPDTLV